MEKSFTWDLVNNWKGICCIQITIIYSNPKVVETLSNYHCNSHNPSCGNQAADKTYWYIHLSCTPRLSSGKAPKKKSYGCRRCSGSKKVTSKVVMPIYLPDFSWQTNVHFYTLLLSDYPVKSYNSIFWFRYIIV